MFNRSLSAKAPVIALIIITIIWGGSFLTVQYGLNFSSPIMLVGLRFAAAAIAVSLLSWKDLTGFRAYEVFAGFCIGAVIAAGYAAQTVGLQSISSSESAFLTALYVPLVPFFMWLCFKNRPHLMTWLGALFAFSGLVFLTGNGFGAIQLNSGQIITLLGSIAIAFEIILISYFAGKVNLRRVTLLQLVMNWAQRMVDPSQAAIIYAGEPVWAALAGRLAGERLAPLALMGGLLVVIGVIVSEWRPKFLRRKNTASASS